MNACHLLFYAGYSAVFRKYGLFAAEIWNMADIIREYALNLWDYAIANFRFDTGGLPDVPGRIPKISK
jgi:hypothetical protein